MKNGGWNIMKIVLKERIKGHWCRIVDKGRVHEQVIVTISGGHMHLSNQRARWLW